MTIYVFLGMLFSFLNKRLGESRRIQFRDCPRQMVVRDIKQSVKSLLEISSFLAVGVYLQQRGLGITPVRLSVPNVILMFVASMLLFDTWFYWMHRLIHTRSLYKRIHKWHHQAVTPTIWSNNSDTFLDTLFLQSYFTIAVFLLPIPFPVLIVHKIFDQVTGMIGHSGYEYFPGKASRYPSPLIGVTFHDQHHQHVAYNYATHFSFWDRVMKTVHPNYDQTIDTFTTKSGAMSLESPVDS
jgi:lathosterol oxidase